VPQLRQLDGLLLIAMEREKLPQRRKLSESCLGGAEVDAGTSRDVWAGAPRTRGDGEDTPTSRRHRPVSELRLPGSGTFAVAVPFPGGDALRAALWQTFCGFLFSHAPPSGNTALRQVWASPPIEGKPEAMPKDVQELLESWFSLVEMHHVYAFVETVHASLEPDRQLRFAHLCNGVLERFHAHRRFVLQCFVPITSKADITTIERAFASLRRVGGAAKSIDGHLRAALRHLTGAPEADPREAIHEAIRAAREAGAEVIGDAHATLDETLDRLDRRGLLDKPLKAAYGGLFAYAADRRRVSPDDARLVIVMCAGFVAHLAHVA
jgi:hypothetical protein